MNRRYRLGALFLTLGVLLGSQSAWAGSDLFDQLRIGVYEHDSGLVGTNKESGADIAVEVLSREITALRLIGAPRIVLGAAINTEGKTNQVYLGLADQWNFVEGVFTEEDAFFLGGTVGGVWHDGKKDVRGTSEEADWKSHGSHFLFRTGAEFGYQINSVWSVAVGLNHISNANLAKPNEGSNNIGMRVGMML